MKLDLRDVQFVAFRRGRGPGGQNLNKVATSIRAKHLPTGIVITSVKERSLTANKTAAIEILTERLDRLESDQRAAVKHQRHQDKPDAAYGHAIRTYRLCGNEQGVLDSRTGVRAPVAALTRGDIDCFIEAELRSRMNV